MTYVRKVDCAKFKYVKTYWPDPVRIHMNCKSEFYERPEIYQYGFYDGYQLQNAKIDEAIQLIQDARTAFANNQNVLDSKLQDAIIKLLEP